ncbi:hypothetical protein HK405_002630 [Cladochytrium tenue]|nr:hypothetical protein HK405_002630 [Cladochytrium tenue]
MNDADKAALKTIEERLSSASSLGVCGGGVLRVAAHDLRVFFESSRCVPDTTARAAAAEAPDAAVRTITPQQTLPNPVASPGQSGGVPLVPERQPLSPGAAKFVDFYELQQPVEAFGAKAATELHDFAALLDAAHPASFGRGGDTIYDRSYRDAFTLTPTSAFSVFHPASSAGGELLHTISEWMVPSPGMSLRAEFYRLNVYTAGGHFGPHVDTPHSSNLVGSLVVWLPTPHDGGELVVRSRGANAKETVFDWSTDKARTAMIAAPISQTIDSGSSQTGCIFWAAFFSDCEHEISPVKDGFRITLVFNLYAQRLQVPVMTHYDNIFVEELKHLTELPSLRGRRIGIEFEHFYAMSRMATEQYYFGTTAECTPNFPLKGRDLAMQRAAMALGLKVECKAIYSTDRSRVFISDCFHVFDPNEVESEDLVSFERLVWELFGAHAPADLVWLRKSYMFENFGAYVTYGNEPTLYNMYLKGALVISMPPAIVSRNPSRPDTVSNLPYSVLRRLALLLHVDDAFRLACADHATFTNLFPILTSPDFACDRISAASALPSRAVFRWDNIRLFHTIPSWRWTRIAKVFLAAALALAGYFGRDSDRALAWVESNLSRTMLGSIYESFWITLGSGSESMGGTTFYLDRSGILARVPTSDRPVLQQL